ncbi:MAG TPA: S8 family serine peptidase [Candidatus Dormibacteraeota bacterium]|nr:S8 family serine peptidase [Candidatus Dormibacteraeota bacterium]
MSCGATALTGVTPASAHGGPMVPVIVRGAGAGCSTVVAEDVAAVGGRAGLRLDILDGESALVPLASIAALASAPCVAEVTPDGRMAPESIGTYDPTTDVGSLYNTTTMIGAQTAWSKNYTGNKIGVAVIDTGVAPVAGLNGTGKVINGADLSFDSQSSLLTRNDEYGHGTHMAGIIAGRDTAAVTGKYVGDTSNFLGVAPDAHILNVKVGDEQGVTDVSQVIAAIDWVMQHRNDNSMNTKVINLSYGTLSGQAYTLDPLAYATEVAWRNGMVVVASAGNQGGVQTGLNDPAYDPFVIAVGAADTQNTVSITDDTVASFSSVGSGTRNPDLVVPGVHITSLRDLGSNLDVQFGSTAGVGTRFFKGSGTSQAAAVMSGAVALYLSAHATATPDQVKAAFTSTATKLTGPSTAAQGAGEINVAKAIGVVPTTKQTFTASTGTGTLENARGGQHVISSRNAIALVGEKDTLGKTWTSSTMATSENKLAAWSGGTFNGAAWSGAAWSGGSWAGAAWSGSTWTGAAWSGAGWANTQWTGSGWMGAAWSGAAWSNGIWVGSGWADYTWG